MQLLFRITIGVLLVMGESLFLQAKADDCDAGHGCVASCDGGCGAVYLGSNGSCTKMCASRNAASIRTTAQDAVKALDLSDAEIRDLLKKDEMKKKISAILCSSNPIDRHGK
jgi:hypothetical protein